MTTSLTTEISRSLHKNGQSEEIASSIGTHLSKTEKQLMKLYAAPSADELEKSGKTEKQWLKENGINGFSTIEGAQQGMNIRYQRAQTTLQAFMTLMKNSFDTMRELIRNMRLN